MGTSIFTCLYGFDQSGSCDVAYQLSGGTLIGVAAFKFSATHYAVAITGGRANIGVHTATWRLRPVEPKPPSVLRRQEFVSSSGEAPFQLEGWPR